jgi:hypothetical protein
MKPLFRTFRWLAPGALIVGLTVPFGGCDDNLDFPWFDLPDTITLYSLARPEYIGMASAVDVIGKQLFAVESPATPPSSFDIALTEIDGEFVLLPAGVFEAFDIEPGIAVDSSGKTFDELKLAPRDGYVTDAPVPLRTGRIYAIKTRRDFQGCSRYGKLEALRLDADGSAELVLLRNTNCNDRELDPPDPDTD